MEDRGFLEFDLNPTGIAREKRWQSKGKQPFRVPFLVFGSVVSEKMRHTMNACMYTITIVIVITHMVLRKVNNSWWDKTT